MRFITPAFLLILVLAINGCQGDASDTITVHADQVRYRMAGGMGASWHAISEDSIDESPEYRWALRYKNSRGSAWGGNPPAVDTAIWRQIYDHASWLGFTWLRVELSARMYEPERDRFDWENEEMQALYRILDWAQASGADVFLQQMWSNVRWNSFPGVQPLLSAPGSVEDFADGIASLVDHLTSARKYTCIKWVCITNEPPGGSWGSWWSEGERDAPLTPALKAVREALDRKNIKIPLSGPDWTDLPAFDEKKIDFDQYIGAYDIHSYQGMDEAKEGILRQWADWAGKHGKPLFLSEMGDMRLGWKDDNPGPKSFAAALSNAETVLRGLNAGVSGFNRWSFTNRGDLDGQWQLIRTWDYTRRRYLDTVMIEPAAYYGYGILTRFCSARSDVLKTDHPVNDSLLCQALKNNRGQLTIYILNKKTEKITIDLNISGTTEKQFFLYRVTENDVNRPDFRMDPVSMVNLTKKGSAKLELPAQSISVLSGMNVSHSQPAKNR